MKRWQNESPGSPVPGLRESAAEESNACLGAARPTPEEATDFALFPDHQEGNRREDGGVCAADQSNQQSSNELADCGSAKEEDCDQDEYRVQLRGKWAVNGLQ